MSDKEKKRLERFGWLKPPEFSGAESEDAQDFIDRLDDAVPLTWHDFLVLFLDKFVLQTRKELYRKFEQLRYNGMIVTQYKMRFTNLAHHAVWFIPTKREKIRRFIDGLNYGIRFVPHLEFSSTKVEVVLLDPFRQLAMFLVVIRLATVPTVHTQPSYHSVHYRHRVLTVLHLLRFPQAFLHAIRFSSLSGGVAMSVET
uniref:Uncharacterized protein LOC104247675 n=1 Tax=Nicotiana sylvestris TaxID=4096 RepID=A0A1U7YS53_NICSY|nr:PREDICTED: uncharacterized protein LOC104247675 [Nicotiana sylvestris]